MKIFLAGAVTTANESQLSKYDKYIAVLSKYGILTTPNDIWDYREKCINQNPTYSKIQIDHLMTDFDLNQVKNSDIIVCDISMQSIGVGIELGVAYSNKNKLIFCYEKGSYVSSMITGTFDTAIYIEYEDMSDLEKQLDTIMKNM